MTRRSRSLIAALAALPLAGGLTSTVTGDAWTLQLTANQVRTYDVRATLAGLDREWKPCGVEVAGERVPFGYSAGRRVLELSADVAAAGMVRVTACR